MDNINCRFDVVKEGEAELLYPKANSVFYNPVQEFNRDLTIAVITEYIKGSLGKKNIEAVEFARNDPYVATLGANDTENVKEIVYKGEICQDGITILEALSATGLRSVRFAKELPGVKKIVANDLSQTAFENIERNVKHNNVGHVVLPNCADAMMLMYESRNAETQFDVVDIDPYGSATRFLDAAVQAVKDGGLLCVTCTDMAVMAGNCPEACWSKYHTIPLKTKACHEQALRILLQAISSAAARHSRYVEPLISVSIDFYVRIFVRIKYGPAKANASAGKHIQVYRCCGCSSFHVHPLAQVNKHSNGISQVCSAGIGPPVQDRCDQCNHRHKVGGPFWGAPMHDADFVSACLSSIKNFRSKYKSSERLIGTLTMISEELPDVPFYYINDELSSVLRCDAPPVHLLRSAILNAGYRVSSFHGRIRSIKTDAPHTLLWDIMRTWIGTQPERKERLVKKLSKMGEGTAAKLIIAKAGEDVDLTLRKDAEAESRRKGIVIFPDLPPNWGPKSRASVRTDGTVQLTGISKSARNQGKRRNQLRLLREENLSKKTKEESSDNNQSETKQTS